MHDKWNDEEQLGLSEFLKLAPVAHEIITLSKEMGISNEEIMLLLESMTQEEIFETQENKLSFSSQEADYFEENNEEDFSGSGEYEVSLQIKGNKKFPSLGFVAEFRETEDLSYFFETVLDMIEQLEDVSE